VLKGPVLPLAFLLSSPALWSAFVTGSMPTMTALTRFLIAVVVAAIMLSVLRSVTADYRKAARRRELLSKLPPELRAKVKD
jgi:hypothetical protein